jgi:hypothetical protein
MVAVDPLATLDVNLDDLQAELEATSRVATALEKDAVELDRTAPESRPPHSAMSAVRRRSQELRQCLVEQRKALRELRDSVEYLREALGHRQGKPASRRAQSDTR